MARAIIYRALVAMKAKGFKYAVAGTVRPEFAANVKRNFDAIKIHHSIGSYDDMLDTSIA